MRTTLPLPARFLAFALVGGLCLGLNTLALWALTSGLGIHYLASTAIAFATITPLGFMLNKVLTFRTHRQHTMVELPRYVANMGMSFAVNLGLMYVLVSLLGMWYLPASLLVAAMLVVVNFLVSDSWSFQARR
jgi:putative flippase GtrA